MQFFSLKRKKKETEFIFDFYFKMQSNSLLIPENQSRFKRNVLFLNVFLRESKATLKTAFFDGVNTTKLSLIVTNIS